MVGGVGGGGYVVAIFCVRYCCGGARTILCCRNFWSWEGDIEVASVSHVCWGREVFGEDITGVAGGFNSPDVYFSVDIVLADSMVADVNTPAMFIHSRPSRNVFGCLVIRKEVSCSRCVAIEL